jgi:hypothetical protein
MIDLIVLQLYQQFAATTAIDPEIHPCGTFSIERL